MNFEEAFRLVEEYARNGVYHLWGGKEMREALEAALHILRGGLENDTYN